MATLKALAQEVRITSTYPAKLPWEEMDDWQKDANSYRVVLRYKGRQMTLDFWQGTGITHDPTAEAVLDCLLFDATACDQSFEDWCSNLGYDTDSRNAEQTFHACQKSGKNVRRLLGADFKTFMESER